MKSLSDSISQFLIQTFPFPKLHWEKARIEGKVHCENFNFVFWNGILYTKSQSAGSENVKEFNLLSNFLSLISFRDPSWRWAESARATRASHWLCQSFQCAFFESSRQLLSNLMGRKKYCPTTFEFFFPFLLLDLFNEMKILELFLIYLPVVESADEKLKFSC